MVFANDENGSAIGCTSIAVWLLLNLSIHAFSRSPRPASLNVTAAKVMTSFACANAVVGAVAARTVATNSENAQPTVRDCGFMSSLLTGMRAALANANCTLPHLMHW